MPRWRISCDVGGTFTDCVAVSPNGERRSLKIPSASWIPVVVAGQSPTLIVAVESLPNLPHSYFSGFTLSRPGSIGTPLRIRGSRRLDDGIKHELQLLAPASTRFAIGAQLILTSSEPAPILAARALLGVAPPDQLEGIDLRLGTTRGTNALLEGRTGTVALLVTTGFRDLLRIGDQTRPDLFAFHPVRPPFPPLHVFEVDERVAADGTVLRPVDADGVRAILAQASRLGCSHFAIALLNSWVNPRHELEVVASLTDVPARNISLSSALSPTIGYEVRARAAAIDALLAQPVGETLREIASALGDESTLEVMSSAGGLEDHATFSAKDSLLSGPAGGAQGALEAATLAQCLPAIGLDMGGTSTDVCVLDHGLEYRFETVVGGARLSSPSVAVESVASGGGSICSFDGTHLRVGPESAGGDPGPACYGRGGPLTLTDVNVLLGRLGTMPIPIDERSARAAGDYLWNRYCAVRPRIEFREFILRLADIADEQMAAAVRRATIRKGVDPRKHTLIGFGGAGGLHAASIAARLGMRRVLLPAQAGLLSARGIAGTARERFVSRMLNRPLGECGDLTAEFAQIAKAHGPRWEFWKMMALCRLHGQDEPLVLSLAPQSTSPQIVSAMFRERYRAVYGYPPPAIDIEVEGLRGVLREVGIMGESAGGDCREADAVVVKSIGHQQTTDIKSESIRGRASVGGAWRSGPLLLSDPDASAWIPEGWRAKTIDGGAVLLEAFGDSQAENELSEEIFSCRIMGLASEMGEMLRRTALSVNVKHRLDFSCAVLDQSGLLVANAPHLPVHLGAIGVCARAVVAELGCEPGDVFVTNHPRFGGSHLPDVTVITPVFTRCDGGNLLGFVANRAHHAEIGGTRPGSMPPSARTLSEEGVIIPPLRIAKAGELDLDAVESLLRGAPHPSRSVDANLADLRAQVAANELGRAQLQELARVISGGPAAVQRGFAMMRQRARERCQTVIASLGSAPRQVVQRLDDGSPIHVTLTAHEDLQGQPRLRVDFTGSAATHSGSFNAPFSVLRSATMYALRLLAGRVIPSEAPWMALNEGFLEPVDFVVPEGMLNPCFDGAPDQLPPVAAGNVETSQRVVDALCLAMEIASCSQGTMNNLLLGDGTFGYYETICGGAGASCAGLGESAIHCHMTNTRITDAEILEARYPLRLEEFSVRVGSGGLGRNRGGDGAVRRIRFLRPLSVCLIAQRRASGPEALAGGGVGAVGEQFLIRNGTRSPLPGVASIEVLAGDALEIRTPGGGGFGSH